MDGWNLVWVFITASSSCLILIGLMGGGLLIKVNVTMLNNFFGNWKK